MTIAMNYKQTMLCCISEVNGKADMDILARTLIAELMILAIIVLIGCIGIRNKSVFLAIMMVLLVIVDVIVLFFIFTRRSLI